VYADSKAHGMDCCKICTSKYIRRCAIGKRRIRQFVGNRQKPRVEIYLAFIGPVQAFDRANRNCIAQYIVQCDPNKWDDKYIVTGTAKNKQMNFIYIMRIS
jgi:hypothetical protein